MALFVSGRTDADIKIRRDLAAAAKSLAARAENPTNYLNGAHIDTDEIFATNTTSTI